MTSGIKLARHCFLLEHMLWPQQPPETPLHLVLPRESRPLSDLMLDSFDEFHDAVLNAIPEVQQLQEWFAEHYDVGVHNAFNSMLTDALLLFRTAEALIRVKLRFRNRPMNQDTTPIDLDEEPQPTEPSTTSTVQKSSCIIFHRHYLGALLNLAGR